jgi:hypothetical protein
MRLVKSKNYDLLCRIIVGIITGSISIGIFFGCESLMMGNTSSILGLLFLFVLGISACIFSVMCFFVSDFGEISELKIFRTLFASIGIVTPSSIFYKLHLGNLITFAKKQYDGTSDTPIIKRSETWLVTGKGRKYIIIKKLEMGSDKELLCSFTKEHFDSQFAETLYWYNTVDLGDKTIYSDL